MPRRSTAPLRVVDSSADEPLTIEAELALLFAQEAQLTRQLGDCRNAIQDARKRFRVRDRLLALPRCELLRTRFGPQPAASQGEQA